MLLNFNTLKSFADMASLDCFAFESGHRFLLSKFIFMASNDTNEPLLLRSRDTVAQKAKGRLNQRRLLRSRSAPHTDPAPLLINDKESIPLSETIFGNLHSSFKKVAIILMVYLGVGTLIFYLVRNQIKGMKT